MKFRVIVEYEYPVEHKLPVKAELILHGDRIVTDNIKWIEQEPKTGHWTDTNCHHYYNDGDIETTELRCSCCNEEVEWNIELLHKPYFCENCGADMREVEE